MRDILRSVLAGAVVLVGLSGAPVAAQETDAAQSEIVTEAPVILPRPRQQGEAIGPVTGYPLPRFVSLKGKANVRRGPGLDHKIDWVFTRRGAPLEVIGEYGNWRRVRDPEGFGGWVHYALLTGARKGEVTAHRAPLREKADEYSQIVALAEKGVLFEFERCEGAFCLIDVPNGEDGVLRGWMARGDLWGVRPDETEFE